MVVLLVSSSARAAWRSSFSTKNNNAPHSPTLGILSFETATTMSSLLCLYHSLTDDEVNRLRKETMRSKGVSYLNSIDEGFLLYLACWERLEDLNQAAVTVFRLGQKCSDFGINRFDLVYDGLKQGVIDLKELEFGSRKVQKVLNKMEKFVSTTSNLYMAWESLVEMELSEKKIEKWKHNLDAKQFAKTNQNYQLLHEKITNQRKEVQRYKEISLWSQTFDKSVGLMARMICVVYSRICTVFAPCISGPPLPSKCVRIPIHELLNRQRLEVDYCLLSDRKFHQKNSSTQDYKYFKSDPIIPKLPEEEHIRFPSQNRISPEDIGFALPVPTTHNISLTISEIGRNNRVLRSASPSTVGGSGLTLRYANMILFAERCLHSPATIGEDAREALYEMLPATLREKVKEKLKRHCGRKEEIDEIDGDDLAKGWKEALEEMMDWLGPMAHDTMMWVTERNVERKKKMEVEPNVLLLQTLHYSDLEKTEAAIVEVLVGLSCICRLQRRRCSIV